MNSSQTRTLWISLGVAFFAMFLLYSWSQDQKLQMSKKFGAVRKVIVAAKDIPEMQTMDESMIESIEKPAEFIEPGALTEAETAIGQVAAAPIRKGEQILQTKILMPGPETGISLEVSPTKRAVTVPIDDVRGVSRLIRPGDRLDLLAAIDSGKGMDIRREVRTILQDVPVLATGLNMLNNIPRRAETGQDGKPYWVNMKSDTQFNAIVVEVKPEDAQRLVLIMSLSPGSIFAVLRNPNDRSPVLNLGATTLEDVLQKPTVARLPSSMPMAPPAPPPMPQRAPSLPAKTAGPRKGNMRGGFQSL